jgi:hypothetical protein
MKNTNKDKRIFGAVRDYFNDRGGRTDRIAYHITGRKLLKDLTEEEKSDIWSIRQNLTDTIYMAGIVGVS